MSASQSMMLQRAVRYASHMAGYGSFFPTEPRAMLEIGNLQACSSRRTCVWDRSLFWSPALSCLNPHDSFSSCHSSVFLLQECNLTMRTRRASVVSGLRRLACSHSVRRTASATGRVPPSLAHSHRMEFTPSVSARTLQRIERVCRLTMQLGTTAADSMDIAAAPAWLQSSVAAGVASGAGRDANLLLLHFGGDPDDPPVRERSSCTRARLRRQFTHH